MRNIIVSDHEVGLLNEAVDNHISNLTASREKYEAIVADSAPGTSERRIAHTVAHKLRNRVFNLKRLRDAIKNPAPVPQFEVCAYIPAGELQPVLVVCLEKVAVGICFRPGERGYDLLKAACGGKPTWIFGQPAQGLP